MTFEEIKKAVFKNAADADWLYLRNEFQKFKATLSPSEYRKMMFQDGGWSVSEIISMHVLGKH